MRVVLDTNVIVSAMLSHRGVCRRILDEVIQGGLTLCVTGAIIAEYEDVLSRKKLGIVRADRRALLDFIKLAAIQAVPNRLPLELPDPSDQVFIEAAQACEVVLVTGNVRHFPAEGFSGVEVFTPKEFLHRYDQALF